MAQTASQPDPESAAWIPKREGESISGKLIEVVRAWSDTRTDGGRNMDRGWYPLLRIEQDNGKVIDFHAFTTVAESRVLDKQPIPGEAITITFLGTSGKTPPKGQNPPKLWRLAVHGRDPAVEARNVYQQLGAASRQPSPAADVGAEPGTDELPF